MQKSIRRDLSIGICFVIFFISVVIGIGYYSFSINYNEKKLKNFIENQTKHISDTFTLQLWLFDLNTTQELCKLLSKSKEISGLRLLDHKKKLIFEQEPSHKEATVHVNRELRYKGEKLVGYIEIFYSNTSQRQERQNILIIGILMVIGTIMGAFLFINILLKRYLSRPLDNLQKDMVLLAKGNFQQSAIVGQKIEIQNIIDTFNKLTISLRERDDEITSKTNALKTEISERKHTEQALIKSEQSFRNLFNSITDLIYTQDLDGRFASVNPAMNKLFGYDMDEFIGHRAADFMEPELQSGFDSRYLEVIKKHRHHEGIACYFKKNREKIYIEYKSSLVKPYDAEPYISGIGRDVTEKVLSEKKIKKLQKQLAQTQKMESIGTLAGGIAHDFNNILFPIVGYTEMLLEDVPEDSPFKDSLHNIYTSALRAKSLVKQILTFSRQDSNELTLMKVQPIIKEALKLIRSTIPTTIEIIQDINPDCGVIKADPTQIHQIVMNLSTNAYHAMEDTGGELKVSFREVELGEYDIITPDMTPGVYVCLTVADTGKGMDKNLTDKIFDPFFTTKAIGKGTGMGLSVVHGIVTAMGGAIHVYSEPGKGTEFHVYLPIEMSLSKKQVTHSTAPIQGGTEHILFVDDEEAILQMERLMLERLGYQVTSRTISLEALEAFRANPDKFDLIITDMAMPNMPGDKLSAELTKIRPDIPILLCTGFSEAMSEEKAASLGIKGFLMKPIVMKDLAQKIREVLDK
ncbi:MAG: response regulator [Proteobacteria bacterium]|nr:response regulator [Pseudomonadota bacterium]